MKKNLIGILLFIGISYLLLELVPMLNCLINLTTMCEYPIWERKAIEQRLTLSPEDFLINRQMYEGIASFVLDNGYTEIKKSLDDGQIVYTIPGIYRSEGSTSLKEFPIDTTIHNKSIAEIFNKLGLKSVGSNAHEVVITKQMLFTRRGFNQWYSFDRKGGVYNNRQMMNENGYKVIYENSQDSATKIVIIDDHWIFGTTDYNIIREKGE